MVARPMTTGRIRGVTTERALGQPGPDFLPPDPRRTRAERLRRARRLGLTISGRIRGGASLATRALHRRRPHITNPADAALRQLVRDRAHLISRRLGDPRIGRMFQQQMLNTWQTTLRPMPNGRTFVITGDIPAMWLRDSSAQLRPFLMVMSHSHAIHDVVAQVIAQQWDLITVDPYANAFNATDSGLTWHLLDLPTHPRVWERKYEIDSLALPIQLAWQYWRLAETSDHLTPTVHAGFASVVDLWQREQRHASASTYRFVRPGTDDSLPRDGRGAPVRECGMTWSAFRPSDDPCRYGYNIPGQLAAVHALGLLAQMSEEAFSDADLAARARALAVEIADGVAEFGVTEVDGHPAWAYEVDGLGGVLVADDANMPSLLSLPLTAGIATDDPLYLATRDVVLSERNPYWYRGTAAQGIGSPHTPERHVWPIALAVQALTSTDRREQRALMRTLVATDGGTGLMHESFDVDDPSVFTRPWFSWANSMFCELLLTFVTHSLDEQIAATGR